MITPVGVRPAAAQERGGGAGCNHPISDCTSIMIRVPACDGKGSNPYLSTPQGRWLAEPRPEEGGARREAGGGAAPFLPSAAFLLLPGGLHGGLHGRLRCLPLASFLPLAPSLRRVLFLPGGLCGGLRGRLTVLASCVPLLCGGLCGGLRASRVMGSF